MTAWVISKMSRGKCRLSLCVTWCALSPIRNCEAGLRFMKLDYFYCHANVPPVISTAPVYIICVHSRVAMVLKTKKICSLS